MLKLPQQQSMWRNLRGVFFFLALLLGHKALAQSGPSSINVAGALYNSDGTFVTSTSVNFKIELFDKSGTCLLYSENHNSQDLSNTKGGFSLEVGRGTSSVNYVDAGSPAAISSKVYENTGALAGGWAGCPSGATLADGDERLIRVHYNLGGGLKQMTPDVPIAAAAYAIVAQTLQGKRPSDFIQVHDDATNKVTQANVENIFSSTNYPKLTALLGGTSGDYIPSTPTAAVGFNNQRITNVATPTGANDATNKNYVDSNIGGKTADVTGVGPATGNGYTLIWDQATAKWTTGMPTATDNTKLPLAGGTMTGAIAMGGNNITNTGHITMAPQMVFNLGTFTTAQETTLVGTLTAGQKGATWYNSTTNEMKVWNGTAAITQAYLTAGKLDATWLPSSVITTSTSAGGDLTGTYPNPTIANDKITSAKVDSAGIAINRLVISDQTTGANLKFATCATNEVLRYEGANGWICRDPSAIVTFPVSSVNGKTGVVVLNANDLGLGTAALENVGTAAGDIPQLDAGGKIPATMIPAATAPTWGDITNGAGKYITYRPNNVACGNNELLKFDGTNWVCTSFASYGAGDFMKDGSVAMTAPIRITPTALPGSPSAGTIAFDSGASNALKFYDGSAWQTVGTGTGSGDFLRNGSLAMTGNFNAGGNSILGNTTASANLELESTSNATKGYVLLQKNGGNVGIGTVSPQDPLHVESSLNGGFVSRIVNSNSGSTASAMQVITTSTSNTAIAFKTRSNGVDTFVVTGAGNAGIGTSAPLGAFDVSNGIGTSPIVMGADAGATTRTDLTQKEFRLGMPHYTNAQGPFTILNGQSTSTSNNVMVGGGTGWMKAATNISFFTAANQTTSTGTERMRIDSNGNVGIGTNSPARLLHVNGPMRITPAALPASPAAGELAFDSGSANALKFYDGSAWQTVGTGTGSGDFLRNGSLAMTGNFNAGGNSILGDTTANANLNLESTSNSTKGFVNIQPNGGSVGIGTTSPANTLDVAGNGRFFSATGSVGLTIATSAAASASLTLNSGGVSPAYIHMGKYIYSTPSTPNYLYIGPNTTTTSAQLIIDNAGNVGIGTSSPSTSLSVQKDQASSTTVGVTNNNSGGYAQFNATSDAGTASFQMSATSTGAGLTISTTGGSGIIYNAANAGGAQSFRTAGTERMRIDSSGKVGIGSGTPTRLLDVAGPVRIQPAALPASPGAGDLAFDSGASNALKFYDGSAWQTVGTGTGSGDFLRNGSLAMTGNFNAGGNSILGNTTASANLELESTSNATKGYLLLQKNGGNVGIGTSTPAFPLAISTANPTGLMLQRTTASNINVEFRNSSYSYFAGLSPTGNFAVGLANNLDASPAFAVTQTGNVGIGTNNPDRQLHVNGSMRITPAALPGTPAAGDLAFDSGASNALKFYDGSAWQTVGTGTGDFMKNGSVAMTGDFNAGGNRVLGNSTASANLELESTSNATKGYVLLQKNGGNVGIGTSSPNSIFHVATTGATPNYIQQTAVTGANTFSQGGQSTNEIIQARSGASWGAVSNGAWLGAWRTTGNDGASNQIDATIIRSEVDGTPGTSDMPGRLVFLTTPDGTSTATEKMRITNAGYVGVGTATPARLLHVNGPIRIAPAALPGTPAAGDLAFDSGASNALKFYDGSAWQTVGTGTGSGDFLRNGSLAMTGNFNAGGNSILGNTTASANLTLESTSNATKGYVNLQPNGGNVGIGTSTPTETLELVSSSNSTNSGHMALRNTLGFNNSWGGLKTMNDDWDETWLGTTSTGFSTYTGYPAGAGMLRSYSRAGLAIGSGFAGAGSNLMFLTNGDAAANERMRITSTGNVGIGTTTPARVLHVNGPMRITPAALPGTPAAGDLAFDSGASNALKFYDGSAWQTVGTGTGSGDFLRNGSLAMTGNFNAGGNSILGNTTASANLTLESTSNATKGYVNIQPNGGNVGIGSSTPAYPLDVNGNMRASGYFVNSNTTGIHWGANESVVGHAGSHYVAVNTNGAERLRIDSSGNVGVGTTAPIGLLDIYNPTGSASNWVRITNNVALSNPPTLASNGLTIGWNKSNGGGEANFVIGNGSGSGTSPGFVFSSWDGASTFTERMRLTASGNLGLGTATPARLLHVNGPMRITPAALPSSPAAGELAFDSGASNALKFYDGSAWQTVGTGSGDFLRNGSLAMTGAFNAGGNQILGNTTASANLDLESTSNATKGYILLQKNGGNVGIGTTTANSALDVRGVSGDVTSLGIMRFNSNNGTNDVGMKLGAIAGAGSIGYSFIQSLHTGVGNDANLILNPAGAGNVGVGTTSPARLLHVNGPIRITPAALPSSPAAGELAFDSGASNALKYHNGSTWVSVSGTSQWVTSGTDIYSSNSGNVGIGTTTPVAKLTVQSAPGGGFLMLGGAEPGAAVAAPYISPPVATGFSTTPVYSFWYQDTTGISNPANNTLAFMANGSEAMRVTSTGLVGIGTTNPLSKLHVAGRVSTTVGTDADALSALTLDFTSANFIRATAASGTCGTLNITNTTPGASYTVTIVNATALCTTIQWNGVTTNVKLPSGYTGGAAVSGVVYTAVDDGSKLWVSYVPF